MLYPSFTKTPNRHDHHTCTGIGQVDGQWLLGRSTGGFSYPEACRYPLGGMRSLTLAIETSNPSAATTGADRVDDRPAGPGVALGWVDDTGSVDVLGVEMLRSTRRHDDDLLCAIDRLWERVAAGDGSLHKRDIARVAVSAGPGGYTGVRVAVAAAKSMALALDARCVAVPSALVAGYHVERSHPTPWGIALASKGDRTILTVLETPMQRDDGQLEPVIMREVDVEGLGTLTLGTLVADSHLPAPIRSWCQAQSIPIVPPVFEPVAVLTLSAGLPECSPAELAPMYGREPEAVRLWRIRHPDRNRDTTRD